MAKRKTAAKRPRMSAEDVQLTQDVKRANQRLRQLEKDGLENSPAYKAAERLALSGAGYMSRTGKGEIKFSTDIRHLSTTQKMALREQVGRFLAAKTSTKSGIKEVKENVKKYSERAKDDGINLEDIDLTEALNIWDTAIVRQYVRMYGSHETNYIVNKGLTKFTDTLELETFLADEYGRPISAIDEDLDAITPFEPTSWHWNDIFEEE
jgi:hypothetical protein